jgi:predicted transcriptional regulator
VAVASLIGLSAVIIAGGFLPDDDTIAKAEKQQVALLVTELPAFEVVGRLYSLGIKGI